MNKQSGSDQFAFSLVELLTVIAVISLLAAVVTPALSSLAGASGTSHAATEVSGVLDHARQSAMRMSTWVWVGIADTTDANQGFAQVSIVELASRDGSDNTAGANLMLLNRPLHVRGVSLSSEAGEGATVLGEVSGDSLEWEIATASGRRQVDFSQRVIGFSPKGEALIGDDTPSWIKVPFSGSSNKDDTVAVFVAGDSGQLVVER